MDLPSVSASPMLRLRTMGELRLSDASGDDLLPGRRKELVLLAYIARRRPRAIGRAELAALLWGERPEANARASLRQALLRLKRAVGESLRVDADVVCLSQQSLELDLSTFESLIAAGRLADAVARCEGEFLAGADDAGAEGYRLWLDEERRRVAQRLAWCYEQLVSAAGKRGAHAEAALWAERWAQSAPLDERAHIHLIQAFRMDGRIADARAQHAAFLARYRDAFACDPSPEILRLADALDGASGSAAPLGRAQSSYESRAAPLIGREKAFAALADAWDEARGGSGALVMIDGEEGIGKTCLVDELLRWIGAQKGKKLLLRASAAPASERQPWSTLRELLSALPDAPGLLGASPAALAQLTWVLPSLRERFPRLPPAPSSDEFALREAVVQAIGAIASELPVVVSLDDVDRADAASTRALVALAARSAEMRVLLVLTARPDELQQQEPLTTLPQRVPRLRRVSLAALDTTDVERLLATVAPLPERARQELAGRLAAETGGNPRFVLDILAALVAEGLVSRNAKGEWQLSPGLAERPLPVPASVRAAVARRLARVSAEARALAEVMAVAPAPIEIAQLMPVRRLSTPSLYAAVDELVAQRLVSTAAPHDRPGVYAFADESSRRAIALSLSADRRAALQRAVAGDAGGSGTSRDAPAPAVPSATEDGPQRARRLTGRSAAVALLVLLLGIVTAELLSARRGRRMEQVVAVGLIRDLAGPDSGTAGALADMLATNLARVPDLQVLSNARMLEVVRQLEGSRAPTADPAEQRRIILRAAQLAGAGDVLEGELYRESPGALRLDLRRVDARSGMVREVATVRGPTAFELVDLATARLAGTTADTLRIADVTTSSITAYRFYEEGLRAYYHDSDPIAARALFAAAEREDSTFAMAAFYLAQLAGGGPGEGWTEYERADRLADRASDRERLLIRANWALERNDPSDLALSETLAVRYPNELDPMLLASRVHAWAGQFAEAIAYARRALAMDSAGLLRGAGAQGGRDVPRSGDVRCRACEAYYTLGWAYWLADSTDAMVRAYQAVTHLLPRTPAAWEELAYVYQYAEQYQHSLQAHRRAQALDTTGSGEFPLLLINQGIRTGDFATSDRLLKGMLASEAPPLISAAHWHYAISLRHQGRLREALAQARMQRAMEERGDPSGVLAFDGAIMEALVLLEMGRSREAAAHFEAIATRSAPRDDALRGRAARHRAWMLTHAATALAAAGDKDAVRRLADTVEAIGRQSAYGRDRRLHHHIRGLLYELRGQPELAAQQFRQSVYSWTLGYTRTNLELARVLLQLQRPREAIPVLRSAMHGALDANDLYVTRSELQEMLAHAFDAAGERDSARVYFARVAHAWQHADPELRERQAYAARRVAGLTRP